MVMLKPPMPEPLSERDRAMLGNHCRIKVPLASKLLLRDVADALRGLAQIMDLQSRLNETTEREALVRIQYEVRHTNCLINEACKRYDIELRDGRPADAVRAKREGKEPGAVYTGETVSDANPLRFVKRKGW